MDASAWQLHGQQGARPDVTIGAEQRLSGCMALPRGIGGRQRATTRLGSASACSSRAHRSRRQATWWRHPALPAGAREAPGRMQARWKEAESRRLGGAKLASAVESWPNAGLASRPAEARRPGRRSCPSMAACRRSWIPISPGSHLENSSPCICVCVCTCAETQLKGTFGRFAFLRQYSPLQGHPRHQALAGLSA